MRIDIPFLKGGSSVSGSFTVTGSLQVSEGVVGTASSASFVEFEDIGNKPSLVSGSSQITLSDTDGFTSYSGSVSSTLNEKVNTTDIVNNLTSEDENKPLSALQGKVLQDSKEPADSTILKEGDVEDSLNSTSVTKPLSANQGKQLNDDKASLSDLGSMAGQDSDDVDITGGNIDGVTIGESNPRDIYSRNQLHEGMVSGRGRFIVAISAVITGGQAGDLNSGKTLRVSISVGGNRHAIGIRASFVGVWRASNSSSNQAIATININATHNDNGLNVVEKTISNALNLDGNTVRLVGDSGDYVLEIDNDTGNNMEEWTLFIDLTASRRVTYSANVV